MTKIHDFGEIQIKSEKHKTNIFRSNRNNNTLPISKENNNSLSRSKPRTNHEYKIHDHKEEVKRELKHLFSLRYMAWKITGINTHQISHTDDGEILDEKEIHTKHHVSICGKYPVKESTPQIWGNEENTKTYLKNIHHCNSVWACPVCRFKIMTVRTNEIINISKGEQKTGKYMSFLTLTRQHKKHKSIDELDQHIKQFNKDFRYITSLRELKKYKKSSGFAYIKAFEIMYNSKNGYHPHFHSILYANSREELKEIGETIINAWLKLSPNTTRINQKHIQVYDNEDEELEKYISKMNMALELTNLYSIKNSEIKSINPLNALQLLMEKDYTTYSDTELKKIYNEYIHVTKGIRSITYSKGLKAKHNIIEITDQEIGEDTTELKTEIATISKTLYNRLVKINSIHQLLIAGDNYINNQDKTTILIELRKILTEKLDIPIEWHKNKIVCTDESEEEHPILRVKDIKPKRNKIKEKTDFENLKKNCKEFSEEFNKF